MQKGRNPNQESKVIKLIKAPLEVQNNWDMTLVTSSNQVESEFLNQVHCHSNENIYELPDQSVHLVVTSSPNNVGKEYDNDLIIDEYQMVPFNAFSECERVLVDSGLACINIANVGSKPYILLNGLISTMMLDLGHFMRGEISGISLKCWSLLWMRNLVPSNLVF